MKINLHRVGQIPQSTQHEEKKKQMAPSTNKVSSKFMKQKEYVDQSFKKSNTAIKKSSSKAVNFSKEKMVENLPITRRKKNKNLEEVNQFYQHSLPNTTQLLFMSQSYKNVLTTGEFIFWFLDAEQPKSQEIKLIIVQLKQMGFKDERVEKTLNVINHLTFSVAVTSGQLNNFLTSWSQIRMATGCIDSKPRMLTANLQRLSVRVNN